MSNNELISIIIPVYNSRKYLSRCIESVLNQTYQNIEVILIDDGSTDGSFDICEQFAEKDSRVIVVHKENGGQASARNLGLKIATGEYIGFVDNDDVIESNMYEVLHDLCIEKDLEVCCIVADWIYPKYAINHFEKFGSRFYTSEELLINMLGKVDLISSSVWDKLFNKSLFDNIKFPDGCEYEDYWIMVNILKKVPGVYIEVLPLYHWYQYDSSQSKKGFHARSKTYIEVAKKIKAELSGDDYSKTVQNAADNFVAISYIKFFGKIFISSSYFKEKEIVHYYKRELRKELPNFICNGSIKFVTKIKCIFLSSFLCGLYGLFWKIYQLLKLRGEEKWD